MKTKIKEETEKVKTEEQIDLEYLQFNLNNIKSLVETDKQTLESKNNRAKAVRLLRDILHNKEIRLEDIQNSQKTEDYVYNANNINKLKLIALINEL